MTERIQSGDVLADHIPVERFAPSNFAYEVDGIRVRWGAARILWPQEIDSNFAIPEGCQLCVSFHNDGGQGCIDAMRTFTNPFQAKQFALEQMNQQGHNCEDSVHVFLTTDEEVAVTQAWLSSR